jgi:hypothetical protein
MDDRSKEAPEDARANDPETVEQPSLADILTSIRARLRADRPSSKDAAGCDPFARSNFLNESNNLRPRAFRLFSIGFVGVTPG